MTHLREICAGISFRAGITATGTTGTCHGWAGVAGGADSAGSGALRPRQLRPRRTRIDGASVGERAAASTARARIAILWPTVLRLQRRLLRPRRPPTTTRRTRNRQRRATRTAWTRWWCPRRWIDVRAAAGGAAVRDGIAAGAAAAAADGADGVDGDDGDATVAEATRCRGSAVNRRPNCTLRSRRAAPPTSLRSGPATESPRPRWTLWRTRFSVWRSSASRPLGSF